VQELGYALALKREHWKEFSAQGVGAVGLVMQAGVKHPPIGLAPLLVEVRGVASLAACHPLLVGAVMGQQARVHSRRIVKAVLALAPVAKRGRYLWIGQAPVRLAQSGATRAQAAHHHRMQ